jgi:hypothetical protein
MSPPIGFSKGVIFAAGSGGGGANLGPLSWNYANNAALPQQSTGSIVSFVIAENVDVYRLDGNLLPGLSLGTNGAYELVLSGTTSAFGYAGNQVNEGNNYTLRASDFGSTFSFTITIDGETRDFTQRQIGSTLIAKQFESYGTPNASWSGLTSQQQDATQTITASTGGCNSGSQLLSNGGVSEVTVNSNNGSYGDPCQGTYKRCFVYYTI